MRSDPKLPRRIQEDAEDEPVVIVEPWTPADDRLAGILEQRPGGNPGTWAFPPKKARA